LIDTDTASSSATITIMLRLLTIAVLLVGLTTSVTIDEYDYVVIGSGPGGGSLAFVSAPYTKTATVILMRDSANLAIEGYSVFLIEAGGDNSNSLHQAMPAI
jgi:choline dehydrogenase